MKNVYKAIYPELEDQITYQTKYHATSQSEKEIEQTYAQLEGILIITKARTNYNGTFYRTNKENVEAYKKMEEQKQRKEKLLRLANSSEN